MYEHNIKYIYYFCAIKTVKLSSSYQINKTLMRKCTDNSEGDGQWLMEKLKNLIGTITTLTELILIL